MARLGLLPLLALIASPAQADPGAADRIKASLGVPATGMPGCAVGIFRNGQLVERANAGLADVATGRAIGTDTQFYAASVSKQFTTVALMQLVVAGKVGLDDGIRKYLPELPAYGDKVTVRMLLNHTGGIRESLGLLGLSGYDDISKPTRAQALAITLRQPVTKFEPGTQYDYTNGGFLLASEIVERVAKMPFETYVNQNVLKPLGMTRSFVMLGSRPTDADVAHGYVVAKGKIESADNYPLFGGSGGLITTITDLGKWDQDIDSGHKVWTPALTKLMLTPSKFNNGAPVVRDGRGITYSNALLLGPHWFHHTGGASGFKTLYAHYPDKRIGVAVLCNDGAFNPNVKADGVVAALNEGLPPISEPSIADTAINGSYTAAGVEATYRLAAIDGAIDVTVVPVDGRPASKPMRFTRKDDGGFAGPQGMSITPDDDGKGFQLDVARLPLHFTRVE